jgi:hypothetical protein
MKKYLSSAEVEYAINIVLEGCYWPKKLNTNCVYKRRDDTTEKNCLALYVSLEIDNLGNVCVETTTGQSVLHFNALSNGGQSERVYKALVILAEAIRRDNAEKPQI